MKWNEYRGCLIVNVSNRVHTFVKLKRIRHGNQKTYIQNKQNTPKLKVSINTYIVEIMFLNWNEWMKGWMNEWMDENWKTSAVFFLDFNFPKIDVSTSHEISEKQTWFIIRKLCYGEVVKYVNSEIVYVYLLLFANS